MKWLGRLRSWRLRSRFCFLADWPVPGRRFFVAHNARTPELRTQNVQAMLTLKRLRSFTQGVNDDQQRGRRNRKEANQPKHILFVPKRVHRSEAVKLLNSDVIRSGSLKNHIRLILHLLLNPTGVFWSAKRLFVGIELLLFSHVDLIWLRRPIHVIQFLVIGDCGDLPFWQSLNVCALFLRRDRLKTESRLGEQIFLGGAPAGEPGCHRS